MFGVVNEKRVSGKYKKLFDRWFYSSALNMKCGDDPSIKFRCLSFIGSWILSAMQNKTR